jgi:hypothetical protein
MEGGQARLPPPAAADTAAADAAAADPGAADTAAADAAAADPGAADAAAAGRSSGRASVSGRTATPRASAQPMVPHDVVASVIGRAAELERDYVSAGTTVLDEQAVVEIGRELGLTPAAVREALAEYHAGLLHTGDADRRTIVGPRVLVLERTVPGAIGVVEGQVQAFLEGKLLDCVRRTGDRTVWRPREGLIASLQRAGKRLGRDRPLDDVTEITVALVELPTAADRDPAVRVRLEIECRSLRQGLMATAAGGTVLGGAGAVAAAAAAIVLGDPLPLLGVPAGAAVAAGAYLGPRSAYRRKLAEVELIVQGGLDDLAGPDRS